MEMKQARLGANTSISGDPPIISETHPQPAMTMNDDIQMDTLIDLNLLSPMSVRTKVSFATKGLVAIMEVTTGSDSQNPK